MSFFDENNCLAKFHQTFAKIHTLILPIFSCETSFPKNLLKASAKKYSETYSEPSQIYKMEHFQEIVTNI